MSLTPVGVYSSRNVSIHGSSPVEFRIYTRFKLEKRLSTYLGEIENIFNIFLCS